LVLVLGIIAILGTGCASRTEDTRPMRIVYPPTMGTTACEVYDANRRQGYERICSLKEVAAGHTLEYAER